jgi:gluconokinase
LEQFADAVEAAAGRGSVVLVVMGVSGCGKTTLGQALAERLGWAFKDGDELHPPANIDKMKAGRPLDDGDRTPWLDAVGEWINAWLGEDRSGVVTCSALKRAYRDRLVRDRPRVRFVFIDLDQETLVGRLARRRGHFMPPSLLASQLAELETPAADEPVIRVDGHKPASDQAAGVIEQLAQGRLEKPD